mgnify:CR=1 FL=1
MSPNPVPPPHKRLFGRMALDELAMLARAVDQYTPDGEQDTYLRLALLASVHAEMGARRVDVIEEAEAARDGH